MIPANFSMSRDRKGHQTLAIGVLDPRCQGTACPSKKVCKRHVDTTMVGAYAYLHERRGAGDSACEMFVATQPMNTFEGKHRE